jgi:hypothetical protein
MDDAKESERIGFRWAAGWVRFRGDGDVVPYVFHDSWAGAVFTIQGVNKCVGLEVTSEVCACVFV